MQRPWGSNQLVLLESETKATVARACSVRASAVRNGVRESQALQSAFGGHLRAAGRELVRGEGQRSEGGVRVPFWNSPTGRWLENELEGKAGWEATVVVQ